jgi:hypothetical protein
MERVEITLDDPRKPENELFSNLVDPVKLSVLIDRIMNTDEKRSLNELVEALLEGK